MQMDRTSILGDTIDYMKELLEKINRLQEQDVEENKNKMNFMGIFKEMKPNEVLVRNSPKVLHMEPMSQLNHPFYNAENFS